MDTDAPLHCATDKDTPIEVLLDNAVNCNRMLIIHTTLGASTSASAMHTTSFGVDKLGCPCSFYSLTWCRLGALLATSPFRMTKVYSKALLGSAGTNPEVPIMLWALYQSMGFLLFILPPRWGRTVGTGVQVCFFRGCVRG